MGANGGVQFRLHKVPVSVCFFTYASDISLGKTRENMDILGAEVMSGSQTYPHDAHHVMAQLAGGHCKVSQL